MVKKVEKKAPTVPESVLKRRKRDEDWAAKKAAAATDGKKKARDQRREVFKRAERYVKEYRDQVRLAHICSASTDVFRSLVPSAHGCLCWMLIAVILAPRFS